MHFQADYELVQKYGTSPHFMFQGSMIRRSFRVEERGEAKEAICRVRNGM